VSWIDAQRETITKIWSSSGEYGSYEIVQGCGQHRSQVNGDDNAYNGKCVVQSNSGQCKFPFTFRGKDYYNCIPYETRPDASFCMINGQQRECKAFACGAIGSNVVVKDATTPKPTMAPDLNMCLHVYIKPDLWP